MLNTTLCYIEKDDCYLMLLRNKKEHDLSRGKWIGVGGKFEPGETPDECMRREILEETGLVVSSYKLRGVIDFISDVAEEELMYLYTVDGFLGELSAECNEGELLWVPKKDIFDLNLWEGDKIFLRRLIDGDNDIYLRLTYRGDELVDVQEKEK